MPQNFHYPTFRKKTEEYYRYLSRRKRDLVDLNDITDPQLAELNTLHDALAVVATGAGWPKYFERP